MPEAAPAASRSRFLHALERLHERFLVDVEGVTELWLVRHADAYAELVSLDDTNIDPPLSNKGRIEAGLLAQRLAAAGVDGVWASQIRRAQETAAAVANASGLELRTDERLREVKTRWEDVAEDAPEPQSGYIPFVEPLDEVIERMDGAVRDIVSTVGPGKRAVAVTHGGAIGMYLMHVLKLDSGPLRVLPQFTSVSVLRIKDDRMVVQSIGDIGHLVERQLER